MRTGSQDIFSFYLPTRIVHGSNSVQETGKEFKSLGGKNALVVTDRGVKSAGLIENILNSLKDSGSSYVVYDDVGEDPSGADVENAVNVARKEKCDGIVVVGGGSAICLGRGVGVVVTNGGNIEDYEGMGKASKPPLPLIAIPTTAGSGAEVSSAIIIKDKKRNTKIVVRSPLYFPKVAILDPILLKTLPNNLFVVSGIDALAHGIEGYLTTLTTPITDALALEAVRLIFENLRPAAVSDDLEAKEACLIGSTMANMACGNTRLGLAHGMTFPMEGMFEIPHGIAVGTLLPYVMEFNLPASYKRFAMLARRMGETDIGVSIKELAPRALTAVKRLFVDLDFPRKYSSSQVDRESIPKMARMIMGGVYGDHDPNKEYPMNAVVPSSNIRKATMKDAIDIYERSFEGWEL